jgi:hypothetical protein
MGDEQQQQRNPRPREGPARQARRPRDRARLAVGPDRGLPGSLGDGQHGGADALIGRQADREPHATLAQWPVKAWVAPPVSARTTIGWSRVALGNCARARSTTSTWSPAVLEPALPGRKIPLRASPVPSPRSRKHTSGWNPKPPL